MRRISSNLICVVPSHDAVRHGLPLCLTCALVLVWSITLAAQPPADQVVDKAGPNLVEIADQMALLELIADDQVANSSMLEQQEQLVDRLRQLVEQISGSAPNQKNRTDLPQQPPSSSTSGSDRTTSQAPSDQSRVETSDPSTAVKPGANRQLIDRAWGDLPDQVRQRLTSGLQPQFHPKYERIIREYYRRMAVQEK